MSRREKDLLPSFNEVFRRSPRMCSCIGRSCVTCPYPGPSPLELGVSYRPTCSAYLASVTSTMEPTLNQDGDRSTAAGNMANYDQYSVQDAEVSTGTIVECLPGSVNSNQGNNDEALRYFGLTEYTASEQGQAPVFMYSGENAEGDRKPQSGNDATAGNTHDAKPLEEAKDRAGTSAEVTNGEPAVTVGADVTSSTNNEGAAYNDVYALPLTTFAYPGVMDYPQYDEMFNMTRISSLFVIDYKAFKPDYERDIYKPDEYYDDPPRFTLRNRDDLKDFLTFIFMAHNLNEPDMMFNIEVSARMLQKTLSRHSDREYFLKVVKALLMNDLNTVLKLVDCRGDFDSNVTQYKFMNTEDSSSEDSEAELFCLGVM